MQAQVAAVVPQPQTCPYCGTPRRCKGHHQIGVRALFGKLTLSSPRLYTLEGYEEEGPGSAKRAKAVREFAGDSAANQQFIPTYGARDRSGAAIATGCVESTVKQVVRKRMGQQQQLRWTKTGAQLLLQVRSQVLHDDLRATFERWYPSMARTDVLQRAAAEPPVCDGLQPGHKMISFQMSILRGEIVRILYDEC